MSDADKHTSLFIKKIYDIKSIIVQVQKENSTIIISLLISDQSYHKQKQRRHDILLNDTQQNGILLKMT